MTQVVVSHTVEPGACVRMRRYGCCKSIAHARVRGGGASQMASGLAPDNHPGIAVLPFDALQYRDRRCVQGPGSQSSFGVAAGWMPKRRSGSKPCRQQPPRTDNGVRSPGSFPLPVEVGGSRPTFLCDVHDAAHSVTGLASFRVRRPRQPLVWAKIRKDKCFARASVTHCALSSLPPLAKVLPLAPCPQ